MKLSAEQSGTLLALVWSLEKSDRSILRAFCNENQNKDVNIGTGKDSAVSIFYRKLESWGLAQEVISPPLELSKEDREHFERATRIFLLKSDAQSSLSEALCLLQEADNKLPPEGAILCPEVHQILKKYESEKKVDARDKLVAVSMRGIEKALTEAGMITVNPKTEDSFNIYYFGETKPSFVSLLMHALLCGFLFSVSALGIYVGWPNNTDVMLSSLLPLLFGVFTLITLLKVFLKKKRK